MYDDDADELDENPVPAPPSNVADWPYYVERTFPVGTPVIVQPRLVSVEQLAKLLGVPDADDYDLLGFSSDYDHSDDRMLVEEIYHFHNGNIPAALDDYMTFVRIPSGMRAEVVEQVHGDPSVAGLVLRLYPPLIGTSPLRWVEIFDEWKDIGFGDDIRVEVTVDEIMRSYLTGRDRPRTVADLMIKPLVDTWGSPPAPQHLAPFRPRRRNPADPGVVGLVRADQLGRNPKILALGPFAAAAAANPHTSQRGRRAVVPRPRTYDVSSPGGQWDVPITVTVHDFDEDAEGAMEYLDDQIREHYPVGLDDFDQDAVAELGVGETHRAGALDVERTA